MAMTTKKDIQERNQALEQQVTELQNELTEKALTLHETEARLDSVGRIMFDSTKVQQLLNYERDATLKLTGMLEGVSRQFMWALSMFDTISLYAPEHTETKGLLIDTLKKETAAFMDFFLTGDYTSAQMQKIIEHGRQMVSLDAYDFEDGYGDMISDLLADTFGVPATDQEVPDEVPEGAYEYVAHPDYEIEGDQSAEESGWVRGVTLPAEPTVIDPDFGLHRIDAKDR
jgi:chromosome segregation ATPase